MALFNKDAVLQSINFDKSAILRDIVHLMEIDFPSYKVIPSRNDPWDFLIIKTVTKNVVSKLGTMGMHESTSEESFQEVIAVNVLSPADDIDSIPSEYSYGWVKLHLVVSDAKALKRNIIHFNKG